jgi:opacity protein-like surface antigen
MKLISENSVRYSSVTMSENIHSAHQAVPFNIQTTLDLWEYMGGLRFNLSTRVFQPYVKAGYGWTWFRAKNTSAEGRLLARSNSPWVRKPSLSKLKNLLPNSWHYGIGIEIIPIKPINGIDVGLKLEYLKNHSSFALNMELSPWSETTKGKVKMSPGTLSLSITLNY